MVTPPKQSLFDQLLESAESSQPEIATPTTATSKARIPADVGVSIFAGLFTGGISLVKNISYAALIFSAGLSPYLPVGLGMLFISNIVVRLITVSMTTFPSVIYNPQSEQVVVLAFMAAAIADQLPVDTPPTVVLITIIGCVAVAAVLTGIALLMLGALNQGSLGRYLPYPITGGFLAGISWLLILGAFQIILGQSLRWALLPELLSFQRLLQMLAGMTFAGVLLYWIRRYRHPWIMPVTFVGAIALFYGVLAVGRYPIAIARDQGWLLNLSAQGDFWELLSWSSVSQIQWSVLPTQLGAIGTLIFLSTFSLLLGATNIELALDQDIDLNRELKGLGIANIVAGLLGGTPGTLSLSNSLLAYRLGGRSQWVSVSGAALYAVMLLLGTGFLSWLPRFALGGILLFSGIDLLTRWFYQSWLKLPRDEYVIALIVFGAIVLTDLITGVTIGLLLAVGLFVFNYSRISPSRFNLRGSEYRSNVIRPHSQVKFLSEQSDQIYILKLQGFIFFGTANTMLNQISAAIRRSHSSLPIRFIILDFSLVRGIDFSSTLSFKKLKSLAQKQSVKLLFTGLSAKLMKILDQAAILEVDDLSIEVFEDTDRGFEWCENVLLAQTQWRRQRFLPLAMRLADLFATESEVSLFMSHLQKLEFSPGAVIARQGDPEAGIYFIEDGQVSSIVTLPDELDKRLQTYIAGTICGLKGLYSHTHHSSNLIADTHCQLYFLSKKSFALLEQEAPRTANSLLKFILQSQSVQIASHEKEIRSFLR